MNFIRITKVVVLVLCTSLCLSFVSAEDNNAQYKLIFFEGSDWCMNCIRFEKKVLSETIFEDFMASYAIEVERIDFPQRKQLDENTKQYNVSVAEKYNFQGIFPTLILVHIETDTALELTYRNQDPSTFVSYVKSKLNELK